MLFVINEKEVIDELIETSSSLGIIKTGIGKTSISTVIQKLAQEKRHKTTTIAYLKTYLHHVPHIKEISINQ